MVVEKELRLREGMSMMGMSSNMYWTSWFFTHWTTAMCTVVLLCLIGIYPFEYTNPAMQLIFYSLLPASRCGTTPSPPSSCRSPPPWWDVSCTSSPSSPPHRSHHAPAGSAGWLAVCLLGSAINQWGDILARLELAKRASPSRRDPRASTSSASSPRGESSG